MVETVKTVHGEEVILLLDEAEAGNTRRSDGELVGQFISSCRLAGRRVARSSPTHIHTTRAHPPSKKRRVEKKKRRRRRKKKGPQGRNWKREGTKKKKPPRKCCTLSLSLFFFFSVPGENWSVERVRFFLFLPSLFLRHFAQRKHLAHDEWNEKTNAAQSLCVVVVVVVGPPFFFFFLFNHFETDTPIDKWTEIELRVRVWWV